uniref:Uncharacterized protein n=1 Tax=Arundo donax TaxID=35708 RepID=A0A0A9AFN9_ARUDO
MTWTSRKSHWWVENLRGLMRELLLLW